MSLKESLLKLIRKNDFTKLAFFSLATIFWVRLYIHIFVPLMNSYYLSNPGASQVYGFFINIGFIFGSMFLLAFTLDGIKFALRFASGLSFGIFGVTIIQSPLCLTPNTGNILLTTSNASCNWSLDIFFSNIIRYFNPSISGVNLYYNTYDIFGSLFLIIGGIIIYFSIRKK